MTSRPLPHATAHALLHLTVFVWGFTAILGRSISITAIPLVFYRLLFVVVGMGALTLFRRVPWDISAATVRLLVVAGVFVAVHWILFYACIKLAGVAVGVICMSTSTFFTAFIEPVTFGRRIRWSEVLIGAVVVVGVSLLVRLETPATMTGLAMGLGSALFAATFGTINGRAISGARAELVALIELGAALIVTALFFLVWPGDFVVPGALSLRDLVMLLILAIGCTLIPWLWSLRVLKTLSPYTVALAVTLEPVYSIVLAWALLRDTDRLGVRFYLGAASLVALVIGNGFLKRPRAVGSVSSA